MRIKAFAFTLLLFLAILLSNIQSASAMSIQIEAVAGLELIEPTWSLTNFPLTVDVEPTDTIQNLLGKIMDRQPEVDLDNALLYFNSTLLVENLTLSDYNIQKEDTLYLSSVNAVPEPGTVMLMGSGLLGMLGFRRRELLAYIKR